MKTLLSCILLATGAFQLNHCQELTGLWKGSVKLSSQNLFYMTVHLRVDGEGFSGTVDLDQQGVSGIKLIDLKVSPTEIEFGLEKIPGDPRVNLSWSNGYWEGNFSQNGLTFPMNMDRERREFEESGREQDPVRPFPYEEDEVVIAGPAGKLSGTFTYPSNKGSFPAVVLISGSGPQNRDEEILGHRPFLVLSDFLTRMGFGVLRYDDRGVGQSEGDFASANTHDFAKDTLSVVNFLQSRPEVNKIGLIGHSEGGVIAPIVASQSQAVDFLVLLAGSAVTGEEILKLQRKLLMDASANPVWLYYEQEKVHSKAVELVKEKVSPQKFAKALRPEVEEYVNLVNKNGIAKLEVEPLLGQYIAGYQKPWFHTFLFLDPQKYLSELTIPVLALNGSKDLQVQADQNLSAIDKALKAAGNTDYELKYLRGLNHLFQECDTGLVSEYGAIEQTLSPLLLKEVQSWLSRFL